MVFGVSPVNEPEKLPVPEPMINTVLESVGLEVVPKTNPRAETAAPPSEEILPPPLTDVDVIEDIEEVVSVG